MVMKLKGNVKKMRNLVSDQIMEMGVYNNEI